MVAIRKKQVKRFSFPVRITSHDIAEGQCMLANRCMVRVAVERTLRQMEPGHHHTRVDAGHIRFNYGGYYCAADTPRAAKAALIAFDLEAKAKREAQKAGKAFVSKVEPFQITVHAEQRGKIRPTTRARQDRVNQRRRERIAAGQKPKQYTLHKRVVGFA